MSPQDEAALTKECERLKRRLYGLNVQADSLKHRLAGLFGDPGEAGINSLGGKEGVTALVDALLPSIREAVREEIKALRPLDEAWYYPTEIEALSCGRVKADTVRKWLRWDQIDGESDGREVRIYQTQVEELRKNKWRPLREPKPPKTKRDFIRYLRDLFDDLQTADVSDFFDKMSLADLIEEVNMTACRFGAGHLIEPYRHMLTTREALAVVGRLLAWAESSTGDYFDSVQAADYLGISKASLYALVERKRIVPLRGPRRTYRFTKEQLEQYLATSTNVCV